MIKKPIFYIPLLIFTIVMSIYTFTDLVSRYSHVKPSELVDYGHINDSIYINEYLGWTYIIPKDFDTIPNQSRDKVINDIAKKNALSLTQNGTIKLLGLKKNNNSSSLLSTLDIRRLSPNYKNADDWYFLAKSVIDNQIKNTGVIAKMTKGKITIDRTEFDIADFSFYKNTDIVFHQKMVVKFLRDYVLTIAIGADNSSDFDNLFDSLRKSKFNNIKE